MLLGILPLGWAQLGAIGPQEARAAEILTRRDAVVIRSRENGETDSCLESCGVFMRNLIGSQEGWAKACLAHASRAKPLHCYGEF